MPSSRGWCFGYYDLVLECNGTVSSNHKEVWDYGMIGLRTTQTFSLPTSITHPFLQRLLARCWIRSGSLNMRRRRWMIDAMPLWRAFIAKHISPPPNGDMCSRQRTNIYHVHDPGLLQCVKATATTISHAKRINPLPWPAFGAMEVRHRLQATFALRFQTFWNFSRNEKAWFGESETQMSKYEYYTLLYANMRGSIMPSYEWMSMF